MHELYCFDTGEGASALVRVLVSGAETGRSFALVEYTLPPYSRGPALHSHGRHVEGCFVLEGLLALTCDETTTMLAPGGLQIIGPGQHHHCWNPASAPTRMLLIFAPGGTAQELQLLASGCDNAA